MKFIFIFVFYFTIVAFLSDWLLNGNESVVFTIIKKTKSTQKIENKQIETSDSDKSQANVKKRDINQPIYAAEIGRTQKNVEHNKTSKTSFIDIEGIGKDYAKELEKYGIKTTETLLKLGATPKGRDEIAKGTGLSNYQILEWVNRADLFRVKGIAEEYSDLLEAAGVVTVIELSKWDAKNLTTKMDEVNTKKRLVRRLPSEKEVVKWIAQAKKIPRVVS